MWEEVLYGGLVEDWLRRKRPIARLLMLVFLVNIATKAVTSS
jgi:hypothetical protein